MTRIALIHAVAVAIPPVSDALAALWPQARVQNILDDALSPDRAADGALTAAMSGRIAALAAYARASGARAILFTCSAFGPAIERVRDELDIPVRKPNEAMFEAALAAGTRLGMLATFEPSVASMEDEFRAMARERRSRATIATVCVPAAMDALRSGDGEAHDALVAQAVPQLGDCDAILLAHFSTSRAYEAVRAATGVPVLTSPRSAVMALRDAVLRAEA